jgi:protein gp37
MRLKAMGNPSYIDGFKVTLHEHLLSLPLKWKKPQNIFVNSMSDLFHEDVPDDFIIKVFDVMNKAQWHNFQILTKRPDRLLKMNPILPWGQNIWMGVTIENNDYIYRKDSLLMTDAKIKFISFEPMIGPVNIDLTGMDWIIVGGESGPQARPISLSWILNIRDQCQKKNIAFFFKQWGGINKKKTGRLLEGRTWDAIP